MILSLSAFKFPFRIVLGSLLFFSSIGHGQNLITNPSFESGMTGYNNLAASPASANYAISTSVVQQGTQAYSVTINALGTNGWDIQTLGPTVNLTVGQTYTLTFYARASAAGAVANILFQNTQYLSQSFTLTTTYTAYAWTFVALEANPSLRFQFNNSANVGKTIYLDNFSLPVPAPVNTSFNDTASINTAVTYQTITGLGGGLCYYQNWLTAHPNKNQIYNLIFKDLGVTFLRFFNQNTYTANPNFAVDKELVTTASSLLGYTPKIMISSWSPPAGIKGNNSVNGTDQNPVTSAPYPTLKNVNGGFVYTSFADWWKQSVLLYQQNGIYPDYISLQNEPNWNPGYEGCLFNATESANIAGFPQALSALRTSINTIGTNRPKILGPEVFGIGSNAFQNYVNNFLNVNDADALCYHQYTGGNPQSPDSFNSNLAAVGVTSASKGKQVFMSEYIGVTPSQDGKDTLSNTLNLAWLIHNNLTQANASAYIIWDLIWGGKSADIIGVENPWTPGSWSTPNGYLVQQQYFALKQYTKFVRSGWLRVDAGNNSTNFRTSSYKSIDGDSMAVVILNVGNSVGKMGLNLGNFVASSGLIYQTNGSNLQCSNTGIYMPGSLLTLPARSITTLTLNRNKNPLVSITSPGNNSNYISPSSIPLAVSATDSDGSVVSVKYYDNGILLTTLSTSGFSFNWTNAALGIHTLTAVAMDNSGGTATSNPVFVRVNAPCVVPSTVSGFTGVTTICGSGNLVISAIPVASASGYIWTTTGVSIISGQNTAALTINVLTVGGTISVRPYNSCGTATGTSISINQFPNVAPSVTISSSATTICSGTGITFTATGLNGGTSPSFAWFRNNISIGTGTTINITPSNGDQITARMTAGGTFPTCLVSTTAASNVISLTVNPVQVSSVAITNSATTVCSGTGITLTATGINGGTSPAFVWFRNNISIGTGATINITPSNGDQITARMTSGGTLPTCLASTTAASNVISLTVNPAQVSSVSIASSATTVCSGTGITFTATGINGGTNPAYAWFRNNTSIGTGSTINITPSNGDQITARMTAGGTLPTCLASTTAASNVISLTVNPVQVSSVTIASSATTLCSGTGITFTATGINGGTSPTYAWFRNNTSIGTGATINVTPSNGDQITARMTAGGTLPTCLASTTAASNVISLTVNPAQVSSVSIASSATTVCSGTGITFTATGINGGTSPAFAWFRNNTSIGTGSTITTTPFNGDQIIAKMTAGGTLPTCLASTTAASNMISLTVNPILLASVSIVASANPTCSNTGVSYTASATNGGSSPSVLWTVNGIPQAGNGLVFNYAPSNNDQILAKLTVGGTLNTCLANTTATSNTITAQVTGTITPNLSISTSAVSVCQGNSATFIATASGTGTNPTFAWFVNGNLQSGFSSASFSFVPATGHRVTATMTPGGSGTTCILGGTATSNGINLQVAPLQQVSLSIASSSTQLCTGTGITFTATGTNGGSAPIFTWWVNNQAQSTGDQFSYLPSNGDFVQATVLAGGVLPACLFNSSATSSGISLAVDPCLEPQVTSITGPAFVATGSSNITYSVPEVLGDTYQWTVPPGATITSGQGTNSITVDFGNSSSGQITLTQTNANGSTQVQQTVTIGTAPTITTIDGPATVTEGSTGITYSVISVPGTSYQWTVPTGATITSGQGSSTITVDFGSSVTGFISLNATNAFGTTTTNLSVKTAPVTGVEEKAATLNIELFPNPSENSFTIQAPEGMVQIMDIHGVLIEKWSHRGISAFGDSYPAGVYLIQWENPAGVIKTNRLVKLR